MTDENRLPPLHVFRFHIDFVADRLQESESEASPAEGGGEVPLCSGAFSECSGLEATMEPRIIREGGRNYGAAQRAGPVTFATVVLKRGMTRTRDLWRWFELVSSGGAYAFRLSATISMHDTADQPVLAWRLEKAIPVKFKAADLNARGTEVGVEELHLVHEGLHLVSAGGTA